MVCLKLFVVLLSATQSLALPWGVLSARRLDEPPPKLSAEQIASQTPGGWHYDQGSSALEREFSFDDFIGAWGFMSQCALAAQSLVEGGHHPEWSNVYNKVSVKLSTHDSGGVTELDIRLAHAMNKAYQSHQAASGA